MEVYVYTEDLGEAQDLAGRLEDLGCPADMGMHLHPPPGEACLLCAISWEGSWGRRHSWYSCSRVDHFIPEVLARSWTVQDLLHTLLPNSYEGVRA